MPKPLNAKLVMAREASKRDGEQEIAMPVEEVVFI
jgi:hypothetical protein